MPETREQLTTAIIGQIRTGARGQLVAKGLARSLIWADGALPEGAPRFRENLTTDLLDHGFSILTKAFRLKDIGGAVEVVEEAFRVAAESIESAARRGNLSDEWRSFYLVSAAAAFHIAHFSARAFSLMEGSLSALNLSTTERVLVLLMRRELAGLRNVCTAWRNDPRNSDDAIVQRLEIDENYLPDSVVGVALTSQFISAMGLFNLAIDSGNSAFQEQAVNALTKGEKLAAEYNHVTHWWAAILARHMIIDLWQSSLHVRLPYMHSGQDSVAWNWKREQYIRLLRSRRFSEIDLWPSQIEAAARAINPTDDLIVALPTSAGKTRIAELCILRCLASGKRVVYVTPLRALSAQVEKTLSKTFRPLGASITSLYGASGVAVADIDALAKNQIVVATPEKLDFAIRQQASLIDDVGLVVLDEGHMIGLGTREVRYEVLVQRLLARNDAPTRRLVCLSAIFKAGGTFSSFVEWMRSDEPGTAIANSWRPTRQRPGLVTWSESGSGRMQLAVEGETPFIPRFVKAKPPIRPRRTYFPKENAELVLACADQFASQGQSVLIYCPTRRSVESLSKRIQKLQQQRMLPNRLKNARQVERAVAIGNEWLGQHHIAVRMLMGGVAVHHGGLPRQFLAEIEALLNLKSENPLPITIASPTLAQGLDLSCSALVFQSIYRNGILIPAQEYSNVIGRVGRAFVDIDGISVLTIFDGGRKRANAIRDYNKLRSSALTREMESGIVLLIEEIARQLALRLRVDIATLFEYVLNQKASFGATIAQILESERNAATDAKTSTIESEQDDEDFGTPLSELVDDLDTAILATIENLAGSVEDLAGLLDGALRNSLWSRRMAVRSDVVQRLQRQILIDRAAWIWSRTTSTQRKGLFSAGIGLDGGEMLTTALGDLIPELMSAELALAENKHAEAIKPICAIVRRMMEIAPFAIRNIPHNWQSLVKGWIEGEPLGHIVGPSDSVGFEFVQDGLVYRMVWAVEAIRVYAVAIGMLTGDELSGRCALALTYGCPTINSALLLQAGLPSRFMATWLDQEFTKSDPSIGRFPQWLNGVIRQFNDTSHWTNSAHQNIWTEFVTQWEKGNEADWVSLQLELQLPASATKFSEPAEVMLDFDTSTQSLLALSPDFEVLAQVQHKDAQLLSKYSVAKLGGQLILNYLGPPL